MTCRFPCWAGMVASRPSTRYGAQDLGLVGRGREAREGVGEGLAVVRPRALGAGAAAGRLAFERRELPPQRPDAVEARAERSGHGPRVAPRARRARAPRDAGARTAGAGGAPRRGPRRSAGRSASRPRMRRRCRSTSARRPARRFGVHGRSLSAARSGRSGRRRRRGRAGSATLPAMLPNGRRLGAHLPLGHGMVKAADRAAEIGASALQVFSDNPTSWRRRPALPRELAGLPRRAWTTTASRPSRSTRRTS